MMPGWRDPRWGSVVILATFTVLGQTVLGFHVSAAEVLTSLGTCAALDLVLTRRRSGRWVLPLSATVTGLSLGVLLRSPDLPVFVVAAVAAIGSKHLIRSADGRHVANPSAFGLIVALLCSEGFSEVTPPGEWGTSALVALLVVGFGAVVLTRTRRLAMCATFLAAHVVFTLAVAGGTPGFDQLLGPTVLVYAFFMITDPRTAPRALGPSLVYAVALAGLAAAIDAGGSMVGLYLALVAVCATVPALERRAARRVVATVA
ncbi:MAG TPA: RnfABCDGE type electron transport complex subunit D [Acidimicrobiales bacterium]|nr:RnfABCDGE type electron transport complex subunit D [Acidimicrobiales bacterium]